MPRSDPAETHFAALGKYDTPTVLNVIERFDVQPRSAGFTDASIRCLFPQLPPTVGFATTATFRSAHPAGGDEAYADLVEQVKRFEAEVPAPRVVIFQDLDDRTCGATFGEVMCTIYQSFGCVGLITSGGARDLDQIEPKGFACFANSVIASHAYCRIVDLGVPVTVGGCLFRPGDVVHADRNGVAVIPRDLVAEIALGCEKFIAAEREVLDYLERASPPTIDGLESAQKRMRALQASLADDVRRELG